MLTIIFTSILSFTAPPKPLMDARQPIADTIKIPGARKPQLTDSTNGYLQINKILITGNKLTRPSIILRELKLKSGDVIKKSDLEYVLKKDQQKLFNLHLFNTATIQPIP